MKKTVCFGIGLVLSLIVLFCAASVRASRLAPAFLPDFENKTAANPGIGIAPSSSTAQPGAIFAVEVTASSVADLGGFEFSIAFDPAIVQVQVVAIGSFLGSTGRTAAPVGPIIDNTSGKVSFGGFSFGSNPGAGGTGTLAQITLRASAVGSTDLTFAKAQFIDTQARPVTPLTATNGSVTVSARTETPTATATYTPTASPTATPTDTLTPTLTPRPYRAYLPLLTKKGP